MTLSNVCHLAKKSCVSILDQREVKKKTVRKVRVFEQSILDHTKFTLLNI